MTVRDVSVGVVGATGLVGTEMFRLLEERAFPVSDLRAYASLRSQGRKLPFAGGEVVCEILRDGCFDGLDIVVIDVDDPLALEWAPRAAAAGARVVDNSAAFRTDADVPLVIAEVNPDDLRDMPRRDRVLPELHHHDPAHRARAPAPGGGHRAACGVHVPVGLGRRATRPARARGAVDEGRRSDGAAPARGRARRRDRAGRDVGPTDRGQRDPARGVGEGSGLHVGGVEVRAGEPQDPPRTGHAGHRHVRAGARLRRPRGRGERASSRGCCRGEEAIALLSVAPGVQLVENGDGHPTPLEAAGIDPVLVGRVREDPSQARTLDLWITGDNLRKGAALNAVQLAELLLEI